jgi:hypothetical protein
MKLWKHTLITAVAFFGITSTVLYTSCEKDSCIDLKCKNGGSCADGFCRCPTGYEGSECQIKAATKFVGRFIGNYTCPAASPLSDTVDIWITQDPNKVKFVERSRITDTLDGVVAGTELTFSPQTSGNYYKYTKADINSNRLTAFIEEVLDVTTGEKRTCNFIGFK